MANLYEIQKRVPIPPPKKHLGLTKLIREMEYGDSITIPGDKISSVHPCAAQVGAKVKTRKNPDGTVLVWRVDEPEIEVPVPIIPTAVSGNSEWPKIEPTVASPSLNLPAGYYFQEGPFTLRLWIEGSPPTTRPEPVAIAAPTLTARAQNIDSRVAEIKAAVAKAKQLEDMLK